MCKYKNKMQKFFGRTCVFFGGVKLLSLQVLFRFYLWLQPLLSISSLSQNPRHCNGINQVKNEINTSKTLVMGLMRTMEQQVAAGRIAAAANKEPGEQQQLEALWHFTGLHVLRRTVISINRAQFHSLHGEPQLQYAEVRQLGHCWRCIGGLGLLLRSHYQ